MFSFPGSISFRRSTFMKFCFRDPLKTGTEHTCITAVDSRPVRFAEASFEYLLRTTGPLCMCRRWYERILVSPLTP
ncbi:unnamed protein product [Acanthoscelides obtectus]|uniref:Uncharacterized protein n=1 Tax=Acanthoscelides obtectus TaxID=200917 RepID=A0A9P0PNW5_ACAOB|nr:unnamed protein product [Acanthoscelides obtectus]CAK1637927.1 hypothetical protein AOBTE_LOCUS10296 [Acanthoscelides obtectus]